VIDPIRVRLGEEAIGQRLDRALVARLEGLGHVVTRSQLARAFAAGEVTRSGSAVKPSLIAERPFEVEVVLPQAVPLSATAEALPLVVLHEDEHILVIDKAAGMVVHAGAGHRAGTMVGAVLHHLGVAPSELPTLPGNDALRPGIVHRLDKDTSGVIVVAKTPLAQTRLAEQFRSHTITRRYVGVVLGNPSWSQQRLETVHGRDPRNRLRFSPHVERGRRAVTRATVDVRHADTAVVKFELDTGRTHQIRMHARHLGHPIFGDALYGTPPTQPRLRALWEGLGRHALHAEVLGFIHPSLASPVRFEAPLPVELRELIDVLAQASGDGR